MKLLALCILFCKMFVEVFGELGWLANFCTILLFVLFVIGKVWVVCRNKGKYSENIEYVWESDAQFSEYNIEYDLGGSEVIRISSPDGIYDFFVYELIRDERGELIQKKEIAPSPDNIRRHPAKLIPSDEIYLKTELPEGQPLYQIKIVKYDYVTFTAELAYNGKVGGLSLVNKKIKYGLRAMLYYLCL